MMKSCPYSRTGASEQRPGIATSGFGATAPSSTSRLVPASIMNLGFSTGAMLTRGDLGDV